MESVVAASTQAEVHTGELLVTVELIIARIALKLVSARATN